MAFKVSANSPEGNSGNIAQHRRRKKQQPDQ
jgi:hypothetical protein